MKEPKVSVLMCTYNGMPYLVESVTSILKQSYKNFEFIIVDDGSNDKTWQYLKSIEDRRIITIRNNINIGLAKSLNKALKKATGQYIARMDSDDISMPDRLAVQLNFLKNNPSIDICGTWVKLIDNKGKVIGKLHYPVNDKQIKKLLKKVPPLIHPTWFIRSDIFEQLGGYKSRWDFAEDYDFLLRARSYRMQNINKELLEWRIQQNRRSYSDIEKIYKTSLKLRLHHLLNGNLDIYFIPNIIRSLFTTYLIPTNLKRLLNEPN